MRFAEQGGERHDKSLFAEIVADVQGPIAPVLRAGRHDERPHDNGGALMRLGKAGYRGGAWIDKHPFRIGVMEIDLSHVPPPCEKRSAGSMDSSGKRCEKSGRSRTGKYGECGQF